MNENQTGNVISSNDITSDQNNQLHTLETQPDYGLASGQGVIVNNTNSLSIGVDLSLSGN